MNTITELTDHNAKNFVLLDRMLRLIGAKKMTPVEMATHLGVIARFKALLIKPAVSNAHDAAQLLAGEMAEERKLVVNYHQLERECFG